MTGIWGEEALRLRTKLPSADTCPGKVREWEQSGASRAGVRVVRKYVSSVDRGACSLLGRIQAGPAWVSAGNRGGDGLRWAVTPQPLSRENLSLHQMHNKLRTLDGAHSRASYLSLRMSISGSLFLGVSKSNTAFFSKCRLPSSQLSSRGVKERGSPRLDI